MRSHVLVVVHVASLRVLARRLHALAAEPSGVRSDIAMTTSFAADAAPRLEMITAAGVKSAQAESTLILECLPCDD